MRQINRALRQVRGVVPALVLTAGLVAGGTVTAAPAFADAGPLSLTVHAPAMIGAAGEPVEFTETIANPGDQGFAVVLELAVETGIGAPQHALSLAYRNDFAGGNWEDLPLEQRTEEDRIVYTAQAGKILVMPGGADVHLRLGAPMGTPHDGASNGGVGPVLTLRSEVKGWRLDHPVDPPVQDTHRIAVGTISNGIAGVPRMAIAGGAPIEFDAVLKNPTPSAYVNVGNVLFTDKRAKLEMRGADGGWTALTPVSPGAADEGIVGFHLGGRDSSVGPDSTTTRRVRVSYPADMPAGMTRLNPCVFVNEGLDQPFRGTTTCSDPANVQIAVDAGPQAPAGTGTAGTDAAPAGPKAKNPAPAHAPKPAADVTTAPATPPAPAAAPSVTATPTAAAPAPSGTGAAPAPADRLAGTGADRDRTGVIAGASAMLLGAGTATFALLRRRRRSV
ncbi:hypothetical protein ACIOJE_16600 [Kitasatospora sp. NPDC087861]|uniref:hypothetical protein n=1 Tax=Kitasatospora sp. NPDC087861 TaxID=3364070 RepID=UPI0038148B26